MMRLILPERAEDLPLADYDYSEFGKPRRWRQLGLSWLCARCGEVWARLRIEGRLVEPIYSICATCSAEGTIMVPGSILSISLSELLLDSLPLWAWQREVEVHCRWATEAL